MLAGYALENCFIQNVSTGQQNDLACNLGELKLCEMKPVYGKKRDLSFQFLESS